MSPQDRARIDRMSAELHTIRRDVRLMPARWSSAAPVSTHKTIVIVGGNAAQIGNSLDGIQYAADPIVLPKAYDPDVDTVYIAGLGYGALYEDGVRVSGYVLVRHNTFGYQIPILSGTVVRVVGTTTVSYVNPPDPDVALTAYLFDFV